MEAFEVRATIPGPSDSLRAAARRLMAAPRAHAIRIELTGSQPRPELVLTVESIAAEESLEAIEAACAIIAPWFAIASITPRDAACLTAIRKAAREPAGERDRH